MKPEFREYFRELIGRHTGVDAVVLACTELPLAIDRENFATEIINPTELQCREAFEFAIGL